MRVAAIQMSSGADVGRNLEVARELLEAARADGCEFAALPENFALMPENSRDKANHAEAAGSGPIQEWLARTAAVTGMWLVGGSIPLASTDPDRVYGGCPVYAPDGSLRACYRKIHLFDVTVPDADQSYQESWSMVAGEEPVVTETPAGVLGLTICYDIRFPELYRRLVDQGATLFTVPAAFTVPTGEAHWHALLRVRAIENLAYVIAPGQQGRHPDNRSTFGHSLIVDPWGRVLAEAAEGPGFVAAELEPALPGRLRRDFPVLENRRLTGD